MTLLERLGLWVRRQKCKMYVGTCPLCDPGKSSSNKRG